MNSFISVFFELYRAGRVAFQHTSDQAQASLHLRLSRQTGGTRCSKARIIAEAHEGATE